MRKEEDATEDRKPRESPGALSRRRFLKNAGLITGGAMGSSVAAVSPIAEARVFIPAVCHTMNTAEYGIMRPR